MSLSASELEAAYKAVQRCLGEQRWDDVLQYVDSTLDYNGRQISPKDWVDYLKDGYAKGCVSESTESALIVDEEQQCVVVRLCLMATPTAPIMGLSPPAGRKMFLRSHSSTWFKNGKYSKVRAVSDSTLLRKQLEDPSYRPEPEKINDSPAPEGKRLSKGEIEKFYRTYVDLCNAAGKEEELVEKCVHQGDIIFNNEIWSPSDYKALIKSIQADALHTHLSVEDLVIEEEKQRIAVRLKIRRIPKRDCGPLTAGRTWETSEQVIYQLNDGKISGVWPVMDLTASKEVQEPEE